MLKKIFHCFFFATILFAQGNINTGFRASRILQSYPNNEFPSPDYWVDAGNFISAKFDSTTPSSVWIVSLYCDNGYTQLNFPNPGGSYPYIWFVSQDKNEEYLTRFDNEGFKVWLQVEPGAASVDTLIHLVLTKYKHHPCVVGFGIDVEWYLTNLYSGGKKLTDAEAQRWENKVKSFDSTYTLFLKHYGQSWMPSNYRGQIIFVDDSQQFTGLTHMVNEFKSWGNKFSPNKVAFQFGYKADKTWWSQYSDPMQTIGNSLLSNIPNCSGLFWVDFTINDIFPVTDIENSDKLISKYKLSQNYPNPFNPTTKIRYSIPPSPSFYQGEVLKDGFVTLKIYDILGREIQTLANEYQSAGSYEVEFDARDLSSGVYFYQLRVGNFIQTKKMLLLK